MCAYCCGRVHNGRTSYKLQLPYIPSEQVLCVGFSRKQPILKWEDNLAWPGKLTLTERALYFEVIPFEYQCLLLEPYSYDLAQFIISQKNYLVPSIELLRSIYSKICKGTSICLIFPVFPSEVSTNFLDM